MKHGASLLLVGLLGSVHALAQSSGIRLIFPEFTKVYAGKSMWSSYQVGMGFDHDLNDRISMGIDLTFDLQRATGESGQTIDVPYAGLIAHYYGGDRLLSGTYRTAFSFSDNTEGSFYLGSFFGFRSFKQALDLSYVEDPSGWSSDNGPFQSQVEAKKILFPIGLRFGMRGSLEGGFADLYTQLGYTIGGGESAFTQAYFSGEEFDLSTLSFTLGLAYGFGW
jgi:hypothetical protein